MQHFILGDLDIGSLLRASDTLHRFYKKDCSEQERAGTVQAFEFCYELSWKTMKRILAHNGIDVASPRASFRAAGKEGIVEKVETWFEFIEMRNKTVHVYDETVLQDIFSKIPTFIKELDKFIEHIKKL